MDVQLRFVFDRKKEATAFKQGRLEIEVREIGTTRPKYIATGIKLFPHQYSTRNGFACVNHPNSGLIEKQAWELFYSIQKDVLEEGGMQGVDTAKRKKDAPELHKFFLKIMVAKHLSEGTARHHKTLFRLLSECGITTFYHLTVEKIADFDLNIRTRGNDDNSVYKKHSILRAYCAEALRHGYIKANPYDRFPIRRGHVKTPTFLNENEILKVLDYTPQSEHLERVRDLFVFQMFTGMAYGDLAKFRKEDVSEEDGMRIIRSNRKKTDESFVILLLPEAEKIAEKYDYRLPVISNAKYNDYLKAVILACGINKRVTTHTARHTFATHLLNCGVPIESVSKAMGHATIGQTQHYARLAGRKVIGDMKKLL